MEAGIANSCRVIPLTIRLGRQTLSAPHRRPDSRIRRRMSHLGTPNTGFVARGIRSPFS